MKEKIQAKEGMVNYLYAFLGLFFLLIFVAVMVWASLEVKMISLRDVYQVCLGAYQNDYKWDHLFQGEGDDGTYVGVKRVGNIDVVAFRGSSNIEDWFRNFMAWDVKRDGLGWVANGFMDGLEGDNGAFENLKNVVGDKWIGTGHSRGAAEVTLYSGMMSLVHRPPMVLIPFAPPRTGQNTLTDLLSPIETYAFENKNDPVVAVPPWCLHPYQMIDVDVPPEVNDPWGPLARHHIELYGQAVYAMEDLTW